jgi:hypothetical protein
LCQLASRALLVRPSTGIYNNCNALICIITLRPFRNIGNEMSRWRLCDEELYCICGPVHSRSPMLTGRQLERGKYEVSPRKPLRLGCHCALECQCLQIVIITFHLLWGVLQKHFCETFAETVSCPVWSGKLKLCSVRSVATLRRHAVLTS